MTEAMPRSVRMHLYLHGRNGEHAELTPAQRRRVEHKDNQRKKRKRLRDAAAKRAKRAAAKVS